MTEKPSARQTLAVALLVLLLTLNGCLLFGGDAENSSPRGDPVPADDTASEDRATDTVSTDSQDRNNTVFSEVSTGENFSFSSGGELEHENGTFLEGTSVAGAYVTDYDNDGRTDVLTVGEDDVSLLRNTRQGFVETDSLPEPTVSPRSGLFFDHDNDGWDDLILLSDEDTEFFENRRGNFTPRNIGLNAEFTSVRGATAADYTGNGCLDLLVYQAADWTKNRPRGIVEELGTGAESVDGDNGNPNHLFEGNCTGFDYVEGFRGGSAWSLAASSADFTNDGLPDIHVANDFNNDVLHVNEGDGEFERRVLPDSTDRNGMSSEIADVNGDGFLDIFVSNIHYDVDGEVPDSRVFRSEGNNLLVNQGNGTFVDHADEYGVQKGGWGWASTLEDFDNDGDVDVFQATSFRESYGGPGFWEEADDGNYSAYRHTEIGLSSHESLGAAALDYDRDGGTDLVVSDTNDGYGLYRNVDDRGSWIQVDVKPNPNQTAIGSRVYVTADNETQMQEKTTASDYMSQSTRILQFGVGDAENLENVVVEHPDGNESVFENVSVDQRIQVTG